eukprot:6211030-Pleurochrysis_carterae.AAC.4
MPSAEADELHGADFPSGSMPSAGDGPALTGTATFRVLKHSWKGVYERQLLLSPSHLRTIDEQGNRTNSWTSSQASTTSAHPCQMDHPWDREARIGFVALLPYELCTAGRDLETFGMGT